jgi:hypothetical protein
VPLLRNPQGRCKLLVLGPLPFCLRVRIIGVCSCWLTSTGRTRVLVSSSRLPRFLTFPCQVPRLTTVVARSVVVTTTNVAAQHGSILSCVRLDLSLLFLSFLPFFFSSLSLLFLLIHLCRQTHSFLLNFPQHLFFRQTGTIICILFQFFLQQQQSILHCSLLRMLLQIGIPSFSRCRTDNRLLHLPGTAVTLFLLPTTARRDVTRTFLNVPRRGRASNGGQANAIIRHECLLLL